MNGILIRTEAELRSLLAQARSRGADATAQRLERELAGRLMPGERLGRGGRPILSLVATAA